MVAVVHPTDVKRYLSYVDKIIYCRPPLRIIKENSRVEIQMPGVSERIEKIVELYDQAMDDLSLAGMTVIHYDWTGAELTRKFTGRTADLEKLFFERRI